MWNTVFLTNLDNFDQQSCFIDFPRRGGDCPLCNKTTANIRRHVQDVHMTGEFPCPFCGKIFGSKNKQGSHTSRFCSKLFRVGAENITLPTSAGPSSSATAGPPPSSSSTAVSATSPRTPATSVIVLPQRLFSTVAASTASVQLDNIVKKWYLYGLVNFLSWNIILFICKKYNNMNSDFVLDCRFLQEWTWNLSFL